MLSLLKSLLKRRRSVSLAGNGGLRLLNLGCGTMRDSAWENYDFAPVDSGVKPIDLGRTLPFPEASYDVCYMSHVLEHLPRQRVPYLLSEIFVALKPGGVVRLVVPDLETIARMYLAELDAAASGDALAAERHEWMTLELVDQMVRQFPGGFMGRLLRTRPLNIRDFIVQRFGLEAQQWLDSTDASGTHLRKGELYGAGVISAKTEMTFRNSGEVHRWMYDRVSLAALLRATGFEDIQVCTAAYSSIEDFSSYCFDTHEEGSTRKPDSLFMEARKPKP